MNPKPGHVATPALGLFTAVVEVAEACSLEEAFPHVLDAPLDVRRYQRLSTAIDSEAARLFLVTHPFHPLVGQEFELVGYSHGWGEQRVFFRMPGEARVRSLPASWTDVEGPDPLLTLAAGRTFFRVESLLVLGALLEELGGGCQ